MLFSHAQIILITTVSGVLCSPIALTDTLGFGRQRRLKSRSPIGSILLKAQPSLRVPRSISMSDVRSGNLHLQSCIGDLEQIKEHVNLLGRNLRNWRDVTPRERNWSRRQSGKLGLISKPWPIVCKLHS